MGKLACLSIHGLSLDFKDVFFWLNKVRQEKQTLAYIYSNKMPKIVMFKKIQLGADDGDKLT